MPSVILDKKVTPRYALRFFSEKERKIARGDKAKHSHYFCANQNPYRTRGSVSIPERFWFRSIGTLEEMEAEQKRHNGDGLIQEIDWTE